MSRDDQFNALFVMGTFTIPSTRLSENNAPLPPAGSLLYNIDDAALYISRGPGIGWMPAASGIISEPVMITSTVPSTNPGTGALVVDGGVGVGGALNVGGQTTIFDTTQSTNTTTGALVVAGGVGIGGNLFIGGTLNVSGGLTATQLATTGSPVVVNLASPPTPGQVLTATTSTNAIWQSPGASTNAGGLVTTTTIVNVSAATAPTVGQVLTATSDSAATWQSPAIGGVLPVANGGTGDSTLTSGNVLVGNGTSPVTTTKAAPSGAFVGTTDSQVLTSKTITDPSNNVAASSLLSTSTAVNVSAAVAPTVGQALIATSSSSATWQNVSGGSITGVVPVANGGTGDSTLTSGNVLVGNGTSPVTTTKVAPVGAFVGTTDTQTLINKNITDSGSNLTASAVFSATTTVNVSTAAAPTAGQALIATSSSGATWQNVSGSSITGIVPVGNGGTGDSTLTSGNVLIGNGTSPVTTTKVAPSGAFVGTTDNQTLTSKTITDPSNNVTASSLFSATTTIGVNAAAAPSVGQALIATSGSSATWQSVSAGTLTGILPVTNGGTGDATLTAGNVLVGNGTSPVTTTKVAPAGDFVGTTDMQTLSGKTLLDSSTTIANTSDPTKELNFSLGGVTSGVELTLASVQSANAILTIPNISASGDTVATTNLAQTLTNKNITDTGSNVTARGLAYDGNGGSAGTINVYTTVSAPTAGQVLTATSGTAAVWQAPSGVGSATGLLSATTTVNVSAAAAPTAGQVLTATSGTAAVWQSPSGTTNASGLLSTTTTVNVSAAAAPTAGQVLTATSGTAAVWQSPTFSGIMAVANGGTGDSTLTAGNVLVGNGTSPVSTTKAAPTGDFVGTTDTQSLTNKTITDPSNSVTASSLFSATTTVGVSASVAPTTGQVLTATSASAATWQTPSASGLTGIVPVANGGTGDSTLTSGNVLIGNGTSPVTTTKAAPTGAFVGTTDTQTLTNKNITDSGSNLTASAVFSATTTVGIAAAAAPTSGQVLTATSGSSATWQTPSASALTGIVSVAHGGTGDSTLTAGNVLVGNGTSAVTTTKAAPTGVFVGTTDTQTLTNKNITDTGSNVTASSLFSASTTVGVAASAAPTSGQVLTATSGTAATWQSISASGITGILPVANGGTGDSTLTAGNVLVGNGASAVTTTKAAPSGAFVGTTDTQTLTNKSLSDSTTTIINVSDPTKKLNFSLGGMTTGMELTLASVQSASETLTFPNITGSDTVATVNLAQQLFSKTITDSGSVVTATSLFAGGTATTVNVGSATAPTSGQVLTATSATAATWQNPTGPATETHWIVPVPFLAATTQTAAQTIAATTFYGATYRLPCPVTASHVYLYLNNAGGSSAFSLGFYQSSDGTGNTISAWNRLAYISSNSPNNFPMALNTTVTFQPGYLLMLWANGTTGGAALNFQAWVGAQTVFVTTDFTSVGVVANFSTSTAYSAIPPATFNPGPPYVSPVSPSSVQCALVMALD